jgi:hypothetical protein
MWAAAIFFFFAQVWFVLAVVLMKWQDGVAGPLSFLFLYTSFVSIGYLIYSYRLKLWSFALLFVFATVAPFLAFLSLFAGWAPGSPIAGYMFFFLGFLALYITFFEQMTMLLPKKE